MGLPSLKRVSAVMMVSVKHKSRTDASAITQGKMICQCFFTRMLTPIKKGVEPNPTPKFPTH